MWDNSSTKFALLDTSFPFTCGESHLYWNNVKFQNIMTRIVGTEFQRKMTLLIFWSKFAQKGYFCSKTEKANITIKFCILELI